MRSFCYSGEGRLPDAQQRWYGKCTCLALDVLLLHNKSRVPGRTTQAALPGKHKGRTGYRSRDGVSTRRWVRTGLYSVADWAWLLARRGKSCWELWEHYFSYQLLHLLVRVGGCRSGHLVAETKYPCCCSACGGSELIGGLLEEALPDHTIFPQEESSLALLAKCSSSYGIPDAVEGFTLNPYLMT